MIELLKTKNPVTLSFIEALLRDADIPFQTLDQNMSTLYGNVLNYIAPRILVNDEDGPRAHRIVMDAGLRDDVIFPDDLR